MDKINNFQSKKAMELPINIIVMMIIGLMLFGIGMSLFFKISNSGEDHINVLNDKIKTNIASLECEGDDYICAPNMKLKNGASQTFEIFIANRAEVSGEYNIRIKDTGGNILSNAANLTSTGCGSVKISYLPSYKVQIQSGNSASMPVIISANHVLKSCSFTGVVELMQGTVVKGKTPLIINVQ